jgi:anion-transporting  ArsA/GET3 family ATPase
MDLNAWLADKRLVVCVGSGGVGKTTTAATIGLWGAVHGRRVMVLTIDPAKRLANSLGLDTMHSDGARIDLEPLRALGVAPTGELWAMMLDSRRTFDELIGRIAPNEEVRERILANHIYQQMSSAFAGSQDYMATERIYDVARSGGFDLVVLDTPPVKNALDFLESPGRLIKFLDERVLAWFMEPARKGPLGALMAGSSAIVLRLLATVLGKQFIEDLTEFMTDFESLFEGFRKRHDDVQRLFREPGTTFVTVCAPTESSTDIAAYFQEELAARELPRAGVIVNQRHRAAATDHDADHALGELARRLAAEAPGGAEPLAPRTVASVLARLSMAHRRLADLAQTEAGIVAAVRAAAAGADFFQEVPRLDTEVNDLESLYELGSRLFTEPAEIP